MNRINQNHDHKLEFEDRLLHLAVRMGNKAAVMLLRQYGASVAFTTHDGIEFMQWAKQK